MDKSYWNHYYATHEGNHEPTAFAHWAVPRLVRNQAVFEVGCGNGRDSRFLAAQGFRVLACDQSEVVVERLRQQVKDAAGPHFFAADAATLRDPPPEAIGSVYARFVLHALSDDEAAHAYGWIHQHLEPGGVFISESRSINDELKQWGTQVGDRVFETDHRRRFIDPDRIHTVLTKIGFTIEERVEARGLAVHPREDPMILRLVARKT